MASKSLTLSIGFAAVLAFAQSAGAHPWHNRAGGFAAGVSHPFSGIDHILAMVAVGLCAAQRGGRAIWLLPTTFIAAMVVGGVAGMGGHDVPMIEQGIAASVLVLGLMVAGGARLPVLLTLLLISVFGLFHGYAHGTELQPNLAPATYAIGFVAATAALHLIGIALQFALARVPSKALPRILGGAISLVGMSLFLV